MVRTPKLIPALKDYEIDLIRCGYSASYCRTKCGKHFMWGQNDDNECLTYSETVLGFKDVFTPRRVDEIIIDKWKGKGEISKIIEIYPGYYCTHIIYE